MKQDAEDQIIWAINQAKIQPFTSMVRISYLWIEKNKMRDKDGIAFGMKFVQDALVKSGILPDDGWKWIDGFTHSFRIDKENPRIEIEISQV